MDFEILRNFMDFMAENRTPGNSIQVLLNGENVFEYCCGYSDYEKKIPLCGNELYNIYSCSKIATVVAAMQLLERGKILLSDPLYEYIPEFRRMNIKFPDGSIRETQNPILVGNLFTMTAGFSYDFNTPGFQKAKKKTKGVMDTVETIRCIAEDPIDFEPGTRWQYSIAHDVLAALVEVVSGKKFREYVKDSIFTPLTMTESFYHHSHETLSNTAEQYRFEFSGSANVSIVELQRSGNCQEGNFVNVGKRNPYVLGSEYDSGGAGVITSVSDYNKLLAALANYGRGLNGEQILCPRSIDLMKTNRLNGELLKDYNWRQLQGCGYGLGVRTHTFPERSGVIAGRSEVGWGGAAGSTVIVDPEINLAVFYAQHLLNPREEYYQPRLRNVVYSSL